MFGLTSGSSSSIDPDLQRLAPPQPTVVFFPQNELHLSPRSDWSQDPPDLYKQYAHISKPSDVRLEHINDLNLTCENDVDLDHIIPLSEGGVNHLPPESWLDHGAAQSGRRESSISIFSSHKHALLNNGHKAPDQDTFSKYAQELTCNTEDALRSLAKRKPRPGHSAPHINHFRRFWQQMEMMSQYWNTSRDNYYGTPPSPTSRRKSTADDQTQSIPSKVYTGFRVSTGSRMPEKHRIEAVKALIENLVWAFGCQMAAPRRVQQFQVGNLLIPVTQSSMVWRTPGDKSQSKIGVQEGPVLGLQCRNETNFLKDSHLALTDAARELAGLLLLAEERARGGKARVIPGEGEWYTTKPRWGGGPGGDFGDVGETKVPAKHAIITHKGPSDEDVWKSLKPGPGLWEPRINYVQVGKNSSRVHDYVFMLSSLYHHVSILRLEVHPDYINFLETGKPPLYPDPSERWFSPTVLRSKWYDLLDPQDRGELLRGLWGILSYSMRTETTSADRRPGAPMRQHSEMSHFFGGFKKKQQAQKPWEPTSRSHSIS